MYTFNKLLLIEYLIKIKKINWYFDVETLPLTYNNKAKPSIKLIFQNETKRTF